MVQIVASLIFKELYLRYGLRTDNWLENVNEIIRQTMMKLNIKHIGMYSYPPQSNIKLERSHSF